VYIYYTSDVRFKPSAQAFHNANLEEGEAEWDYRTGIIDPSVVHAMLKHWEGGGEVQTLPLWG
jgi:hypothetical protein